MFEIKRSVAIRVTRSSCWLWDAFHSFRCWRFCFGPVRLHILIFCSHNCYKLWTSKKLVKENFKVPISKFLFSHLILHFMQWTSAKKIFNLDKKRFCHEIMFKTWKSYFLVVDPCHWSQHRHAQSCDVDSGTCDFRLDLSRLLYFCKFSIMVNAKCSFPACMNY